MLCDFADLTAKKSENRLLERAHAALGGASDSASRTSIGWKEGCTANSDAGQSPTLLQTTRFSKIRQRQMNISQLALAYSVSAYATALYLLVLGPWIALVPAALLMTHAKIIAAYLHHELAHGSVFESGDLNVFCAQIIDLIVGAHFWSFAELVSALCLCTRLSCLTRQLQKRMHFQHHTYKVDYAMFDKQTFLAKLPRPVLSAILALEYLMIPAWFFVIKLRTISAPWWKPERREFRGRTIVATLVSVLWFSLMASQRPLSVLAYAGATCVMVQVLRFTDFMSHAYEVVPVGTKLQPRSKEYDQTVTFSITSARGHFLWSLVEPMLFLNFSLHNAHHYNTSAPFHELPAVDASLAGRGTLSETEKQVPNPTYYIDVGDAIENFLSTRIQRVLEEPTTTPPPVKADGKTLDIKGRIGTVDASFLVLEL